MHGQDFSHPIPLNKSTYVSYLVHGRTYPKASLPTDQTYETACQAVPMFIKDGEVVDGSSQWSLPCPWEAGQGYAEGRTYVWNIRESNYSQITLVREFLGYQLHANISDTDAPQDQHQAEAVISAEVGEKIRARPTGLTSQCGRVLTATNIEAMFLFPVMETDNQGDIVVDKCDRVFTRAIHPSEVDLHKIDYVDKMRTEKLISSNKASLGINLFSFRMGCSPRPPHFGTRCPNYTRGNKAMI